ncbi:MAG: hypothetical protein ACYTEX_25645 [Planctomycetota bacterium]|jgi:hypothetical protein
MKRRSFFQSLAAVAGALVLPKAKEVEASEFDHPLESEPTSGIMSATEPLGEWARVDHNQVDGVIETGQGCMGLLSHEAIFTQGEAPVVRGKVIADETVVPGSVVRIQDFGALNFLPGDDLPSGVVKSVSCEINPYSGHKSYFADVIIKSS